MLLFTQYKAIRGLPLSAASVSRCITCQNVCVQPSHWGWCRVSGKTRDI